MKTYNAEIGMIFKSKIDGALLSNVLILGVDDSIDNYEQVDESVLNVDEGDEDESK